MCALFSKNKAKEIIINAKEYCDRQVTLTLWFPLSIPFSRTSTPRTVRFAFRDVGHVKLAYPSIACSFVSVLRCSVAGNGEQKGIEFFTDG